MVPEYSKAALALYPLIPMYAIDCEQYKSFCGKQGVQGFPTVKVCSFLMCASFQPNRNSMHVGLSPRRSVDPTYFRWAGAHRQCFLLLGLEISPPRCQKDLSFRGPPQVGWRGEDPFYLKSFFINAWIEHRRDSSPPCQQWKAHSSALASPRK